MAIKYLSLFSGIGGFEYGIHQVFGSEAKCIGYSDVDPCAIEVYRRRYPTHPALGDVRHIKTDTLQDFDILLGGFPCPSFSICGKGEGLNDPRGELFFEIVRILKDKTPRYFLLENVKGLLSNKRGVTFTKVIETLTDIGYVCQSELLNSRFCGVPQNRERVFVFGVRGGGRPKIFPFRYKEEGTNIRPQYLSSTLVALKECRTDEAKKIRRETKDRDFCPRRDKKLTYRNDDITGTLTTGTTNEQLLFDLHNERIRRLTPTEYERLQSFPDGWTEGLSDTQRYKVLGNSVTTNVIAQIMTMFKERHYDS